MGLRSILISAVSVSALASASYGAAITNGNLVVYRVGDGAAALNNQPTAVFFDEYTTGGSLVQTIDSPSTGTGTGTKTLVAQGNGTTEGHLSLSTNGQYLVTQGYGVDAGANIGGGALSATTALSVPRVAARIDVFNPVVDASNRFTNNGNTTTNNIMNTVAPRATASDTGERYWIAPGNGSGFGGMKFSNYNTTTVATIGGETTNFRVTNIVGGKLYASSQTAAIGIRVFGSTLPTGATANTTFIATGQINATNTAPCDFAFADDGNTVYIADENSIATTGGLQKWTFDGSAWNLAYRITSGVGTATGLRGLAMTHDLDGNNVLFATTTSTSNNKILKLTDLGSGSSFSDVASAGTNKVFRGVEFVPEPASLSVLAFSGLLLARRRK